MTLHICMLLSITQCYSIPYATCTLLYFKIPDVYNYTCITCTGTSDCCWILHVHYAFYTCGSYSQEAHVATCILAGTQWFLSNCNWVVWAIMSFMHSRILAVTVTAYFLIIIMCVISYQGDSAFVAHAHIHVHTRALHIHVLTYCACTQVVAICFYRTVHKFSTCTCMCVCVCCVWYWLLIGTFLIS